MEGIQEGKLSAIFFEEVLIKRFEFDSEWEGLSNFIIIFYFCCLFGLEEGVEGLHVAVLFWAIEGLHGCVGFQSDGIGFVEGGIVGESVFQFELTESGGFIGC